MALVSLQACKAKKLIQKPVTPTETAKPVAVVQPQPTVQETKPIVLAKQPEIDINNIKIQFEFDSSILRTDSYAILDKIASAIKSNPSIKCALNGYASIEGTAEHNMQLSIDRANAVKTYLINAGISASSITSRGFGTSNPVADNSTEAGRILNRRVEIMKLN